MIDPGPGKAMYEARQKHGFLLRELAEKLGVSMVTISAMENGKRYVQPRRVPLMPPEMAGPVAEALIRVKHAEIAVKYRELGELEAIRRRA